MPKDPTKNVDRYKIRGGQLNEFEYTENQGALAEQKPKSQAKLIPGTPPEERDDRGAQVTKKATKTSAKKRATKAAKATKSTKGTKTVATRGASAKKLAARKAAKKK